MRRVVSGQCSVVNRTTASGVTGVNHGPLASGHWPLHLTLLVAVLGLAVPAAAQERLNHRVSLDLKAMAPRDAFNVIATAIGYTVEVAPDLRTPVDIVVNNVRARTALDTICDSIRCTWEVKGAVIHVSKEGPTGPIVYAGTVKVGDQPKVKDRGVMAKEMRRRLNQPLPAEMKFENAPLSEVAARLSSAMGFEVSFLDEGSRKQEVEILERQLADARARLNPKHPDVIRLERALESARTAVRVDPAPGVGMVTADVSNRPFQAALMTVIDQISDGVSCRVSVPKTDLPAFVLQIGKPRKSPESEKPGKPAKVGAGR